MKFGRGFTIVALCASLGLHWFALQSVAWTIMIVEYSKQAPLRAAISQTFDGQHPCSLCHAVQKGKTKKSDLQLVTPKLDLICSAKPIHLFPPTKFRARKNPSFDVFLRNESPPVPPPRIAPA
jgi:hypothetical protein